MILPFPKDRFVSQPQRPTGRRGRRASERSAGMATVLPFTPRPEAVPTREAREHDEVVAKVTAQLRELNVEARRLGRESGEMLRAVAGLLATKSPEYVELLHVYFESLGFSGATAPARWAE